MDLNNILVIAGKPDLSELVSRTKSGAIVMNLISKQKYPVFHHDRISSLGEIRMFTDTDEVPLSDVMASLKKQFNAAVTPFDPKKESSDRLFAELEKALPNYDRDRVHFSDVKKLFSWYNVLITADKLDDNAPEGAAEAPAAVIENKVNEHAAHAPAAATPKATAKAKTSAKRTTTAKKAI